MKTFNFELKRKSNSIKKEFPLLIGISGVARSGKDTLANYLQKKLCKQKYPVIKVSFASAVKADLDPFLKEKLNISAFTEKNSEKELIRPLLVCYATDVCRNKISKEFWIDKIKERVLSSIGSNVIVIIPDVRYDNELKWIKSLGGYIIHVERSGIKAANFEEKSNDPIIKNMADYKIKWNDFKDEKKTCAYHVAKLLKSNNWSLYGRFK